MYGIIFSLALNSVTRFHGSFAGILCTAIAGGAIFSLLIGKLKDLIGLQGGMMILYIPLTYILSLSFWAKPIVKNAVLRRKNQPNNKN
jgi:fucose permease